MNNIVSNGKTTYILGAGSSISHTKGLYPNIFNMFSKMIEYKLISTDNPQITLVCDYIFNLKGKSIFNKDDVDKIDIEEILTFLDIDIERHPISYAHFIILKTEILSLIVYLFNSLQNKLTSTNLEYEYLADKLNSEDTIITFNWDNLLDDILKSKNTPQYNNFINKISAKGEQIPRLDASFNTPTNIKTLNQSEGHYLKLHGSINWVYCKNEGCRLHNKVFEINSIGTVFHCNECTEEVDKLIIPPVLNKNYKSYPIIRKIWNIANEDLKISKNLVFWGYNIPPTDFNSNWLFHQARYNAHEKGIENIVIINPAILNDGTNPPLINEPFINKFKDIFKGLGVQFHYFEYYEDYKNNNPIQQKYGIKI